MLKRSTMPIMAFTILLLIFYSHPVEAVSQPDQFSVKVTNDAVSVSVSLNLFQNMTFFDRSFVLPERRVSAFGSNSTDLANNIQSALRQKTPNALVNNLELQLASSAWSNVTQRQWLNESLSFNVNGAMSSAGSVAHIDLSWKSFTVPSSYMLGGVEINRIGEAYLSGVAVVLANSNTVSQFITTAYQVNGRASSPSHFPTDVGNILTLNFSSFSTPLSKWQQSYRTIAGTGWKLSRSDLGMAFIQQFLEPGSESRATYGLFYDIDASVDSPASTRVEGDILTIVINSFPETIMGVIIASTAFVGSVTYAWERRILGQVAKKRPKR